MTYKLVTWTWVSERHFLQNEQSKIVTSRKTTDSICCQTYKWELTLNNLSGGQLLNIH